MNLNPFKRKKNEEQSSIIFVDAPGIKKIDEQFKGEVVQKKIKFPRELGEEHPFDFSVTEGLYRKMGFVTAVVDKYVDFIVGPGFYVKSEDERAQKIIEDFMRDVNFDTILRAWVKEGLVKGNGFVELGGKKNEVPQGLKVLDAKYMYINRDSTGTLLNYNQYIGKLKSFSKEKVEKFDLYQIAHVAFNKIGDDAYGMGIVYPVVDFIEKFLGNEKEMFTLIKRKAGSPYHVKVGDLERGIIPSKEKIEEIKAKFEHLTTKHEWITDPTWDIKVIDFGNIAGKFEYVLKHCEDMLIFAFQVPEVLMGRGRVPEGLAKVQMDAFERRVQSFQAEIEKIIEQQIFKRILRAHGIEAHVEFEWGRPSNTERNERIARITELLKLPLLSFKLREALERELDTLMNLGVDFETPEEEREREETRAQPIVPGQNAQKPGAAKECAHNHDDFGDEIIEGELYYLKDEIKMR